MKMEKMIIKETTVTFNAKNNDGDICERLEELEYLSLVNQQE